MSISNNQPEEQSTPHQFAQHEVATHPGGYDESPSPGRGTHEFATHDFATRQFATIEEGEKPFQSSAAGKSWGISGMVMATLFFIAILVVGASAERSLNRLAPAKDIPTSGMVIDQPASTPAAPAAYPTVFVQKSTDPSQAPSPLPETPEKSK